ncbi:DUF6207 family protein [Streptomyces viridosporus]|uniref:DUF6207 family protein n=1 Tax=Streptomyces viridosporus TaxID=67581 RepID=UPI0033192BCE
MRPISEAHAARPGLAVVEIAALDDAAAGPSTCPPSAPISGRVHRLRQRALTKNRG